MACGSIDIGVHQRRPFHHQLKYDDKLKNEDKVRGPEQNTRHIVIVAVAWRQWKVEMVDGCC